MKTTYRLFYLIILFSVSSFSQNKHISIKENFSEQFFLNDYVYHKLKKYSNNNKIVIADPNKYLTNEKLIYNSKDLEILLYPEKNKSYDFLIKKVIINNNLAFVAMWNKDSVTALCFYPFLSEFTPNQWIVEEITTRSIK
ncbi:hypothetical protein [Chryseobacterium sp. Leaf201]|uniref:hypothetical protein n=1 Tax=Chryseobacterium sp. Leaf201 TaxID=1735672 RepID=UPI0006FEE4B6|nr:hypothetical protein [Chryseobacterium sp. Leaf201]KQM52311.1 hypothetical protein ASE55_19655 [Chryseobacterium sp. Leaf201]